MRLNQIPMVIRAARAADAEAIWAIIAPTIRAGETYALPREMTRGAALAWWCEGDHDAFVAERDGGVVGTYFLRPNHLGGGSHVCNCGYMTAAASIGQGVARALCAHSLDLARTRGYRGMQFNFVVSTNERAVRLWKRLGFTVVGTVPGAFQHPTRGFVDSLVMYQAL